MPQSRTYRLLSLGLILPVSAALLVYVILKAWLTSFTHDESFTYLNYVHQPFMDIISYKTPYTNNHILNSVLMKYAEAFWGNSELVLRLPNILACGIYLFYAFRLLKHLPALLLVPAFLCLMCHTQLCDFFALARGYGLSFAFMLMSLYHLHQFFETNRSQQLIVFNVAGLLAILSNFSLINFYLSALLAYNLLRLLQAKREGQPFRFWQINRIHAWSLLVYVAILYEPIRRISKPGMLNFGGKEGLIENTFGSLVSGAFYEHYIDRRLFVSINFAMAALVVFTGLLIAWHLYRRNQRFFAEYRSLCLQWSILAGIIALSYLQHVLIRNDFYAGRFALFLYPLLLLNLLHLLHYFFNTSLRIPATCMVYGLGLALATGFVTSMNLRFYKDWRYDAGTKPAMTRMVEDHRLHGNQQQIRLGITWHLEPSTNFYRYTWDLGWLRKTHRKGAGRHDDYYYLSRSDTTICLIAGKPLLFFSPEAEAFLAANRER